MLSSVYHIDSPTGNLPYADFKRFQRDPRILWSAPVGLGDNFPVIESWGRKPSSLICQIRRATPSSNSLKEEGLKTASRLSLEVRWPNPPVSKSEILSSEHMDSSKCQGAEVHRDFPIGCAVFLAPTGTAQDRAIFGTLASVWEIHETEDRLHSAIQGSALLEGRQERETTAILIRLKTPGLRLWMADEIRKGTDGIATVPINEILRFQRGIIGPAQKALLVVAVAVVGVACLTVLITLHQAAERRRRDIAILRSLGANRREVAALVFSEGLLLTGSESSSVCSSGMAGLLLGVGPFSRSHRSAPPSLENAEHRTHGYGSNGSVRSHSFLFPAISCYRRTPIDDLHLTE